MASITIDNLQPMVEYEELSGAELESVIGGFAWLAALAAISSVASIVGLGISIASIAISKAMAH